LNDTVLVVCATDNR